MNWIWVALGGMAGSLARYGIVTALAQMNLRPLLPYGTMAVNIIGCFAIGILAAIGHMRPGGLRPEMRLLLMVGFLGGFTTFSSFGLEAFELIKYNHLLAAFMDIVIQVVFGCIAVGAGFLVVAILA